MIDKERIIGYIRRNGPVIPAQISKEINQNILMSSAVLSEMVSSKELKISSIKLGGSPLYFLEGQESQLINFSNKLNPRDRPAFDMLKDRKVIRDSFLPPPLRVSLRALKDFAIPLQVTLNDKKEIFWKWFLLGNEEVEPLIKEILGITAAQEQQESAPAPSLEKPVESPASAPSKEEKPKEERHVKHEKHKDEKHVREEKQVKEEIVAEKKESSESVPQHISESPISPSPEEDKEEAKVPSSSSVQETLAAPVEEPQKSVSKKKPVTRPKDLKDKFMKVVDDFFSKNNIEVISTEFVKKGEVNCIIMIPTVIGKIEYFVKIKSKKSINDTDLNHAYLEGKDKSLNTLFLTNGDLTNKVKDLLNTRYKGLIYRKLSTNGD